MIIIKRERKESNMKEIIDKFILFYLYIKYIYYIWEIYKL